MNREEIFDKARKENLINDEVKNYKRIKENAWGFVAALVVWLIFTTVYFLKGKDIYHLFSIYFAYIGFSYLAKYFANKEKLDLLVAVGGILVCCGNLIIGLSEI